MSDDILAMKLAVSGGLLWLAVSTVVVATYGFLTPLWNAGWFLAFDIAGFTVYEVGVALWWGWTP